MAISLLDPLVTKQGGNIKSKKEVLLFKGKATHNQSQVQQEKEFRPRLNEK